MFCIYNYKTKKVLYFSEIYKSISNSDTVIVSVYRSNRFFEYLREIYADADHLDKVIYKGHIIKDRRYIS
jgi:predicted metallo-beta-lactamase superfamily hydrolase